MCIRDSLHQAVDVGGRLDVGAHVVVVGEADAVREQVAPEPVSYTHLRAHETVLDLVCRLLLEKKKPTRQNRPQRDTYETEKHKAHKNSEVHLH